MPALPKVIAVAALSLALSGLTLTSSASAQASFEECAGMGAQSHTSEGNTAPVARVDSASILAGDYAEIDVLSNDTDPQGDLLYTVSVTQPRHGFTCVNSDGSIEYQSNPGTKTGKDQFSYGITDGDFFRTATVTVSVEGLDNVLPTLTRKIRTGRHGKVTRKAKVSFSNTNNRTVELLAGKFNNDLSTFDRLIAPDKRTTLWTRYKSLDFVALVPKDDGSLVLVDIGSINTRTGRVTLENLGEFRQSGARHAGAALPWHVG
jgi:Bacterial Ig domain